MLELALLAGFGAIALRATNPREEEQGFPTRISSKIGKLWDIAHQGMKENRFLRAEKALLTILKIDKRNAAAYNRLGILYAKQREYRDAIDCFEIASSIEPSASSLHNLGLIYFETDNYEKAAVAFEKAIMLDGEMAARHIAYAKVQDKLGNHKLMIDHLRTAVKLEPSKESFKLLLEGYENTGMHAEADQLRDSIKKLTKTKPIKKRKIMRPRRVI